jgi:hypothetical protein
MVDFEENDGTRSSYAAGGDIEKLLVRDRQSTFVLVRQPGRDSVVYTPVLPEAPIHPLVELRSSHLSRGAKLNSAWGNLLAFDARAPIDFAPSRLLPMPPEIVNRDFGVRATELLDKSHCQKTFSGRYCLATYSARMSARSWRRTQWALYDWRLRRRGWIEWTHRAHTERGQDETEVDDLFEVRGLELPIFVEVVFAAIPPCQRFSLRTFTPEGDVAEVFFPSAPDAPATGGGGCLQ